jgi:Flp pilus assembly protein TadD
MSIDAAILAVAAVLAFSRVLQNGFVNWDDPTVLLENEHLGQPEAGKWAFATRLIGHYQPFSWLAWSALRSQWGLWATAFHGFSLLLHVASGIAVYAVGLRIADAIGLADTRRRVGALLAAFVFLLHPAAVEPVAWASALPYPLSLLLVLLSFLAYLNRRTALSVGFYAASLLSRATALGYPVVLFAVDWYLARSTDRATWRRLLIQKVPFVLLAIAAALAEWYARDVTSLAEVSLASRLSFTTTAPFRYAARTMWPLRLSPLYPLPLSTNVELLPLALGIGGIAGIAVLAWRLRRSYPAILAGCAAYLALLAPVAGLMPTGVQASADRYMYVPGVVIAIAAGLGIARLRLDDRRRALAAVASVAVLAGLAMLTQRQTGYWRDSITLWTRAAELDPRNDVATYNLAVAFGEAGRDQEAMKWYEQTLALVADHDLARRSLTTLQAKGAERDADRLAAAGRVAEASDQYRRVLAMDPRRAHARAALGVLLTKRGEFDAAATELERALDDGAKDVEVPNALAFVLLRRGDEQRAAAVLARGTAEHVDNVNLKHNLARLLATASDPQVRDPGRALQLAEEVCEKTANEDPRALDTLAAAYAANGQFDQARAAAARAEMLARQRGDLDTADQIAAHARSYRRQLTR